MKSRVFTLLSVLTTISLAAPLSCAAANCFDTSPMAADEKEPIQALTPDPVSREDFRALNDFLTSLQSDWTGTGRRIECLGNVDQPQTKTSDYNSTGMISVDSNNNLTVQLNLQFDNTSFDDISIYDLSENMLMAGSNEDGSVTTQLRRITKTSAEIYFKTVITLAKKGKKKSGVRPMEHLYKLSRSGSSLEISREIYLSGILVQIDSWQLRKGR
jgi:hypothetical protein